MSTLLIGLAITSFAGSAYVAFVSEGPYKCKTRLMGASNRMRRQLKHCRKYIHCRPFRREDVYGYEKAKSDEFYTPVKGDGKEGDSEEESIPDHLPPGAPRMTGEFVNHPSTVPVALSPDVPVVEESEIEPDLPDHIEIPETE